MQFKKMTNLSLWHVFIPPDVDDVFYVLQADKVEIFECKTNAANGDEFFCVPVERCKKFQFSLEKLEFFSAIMNGSLEE